MVMRMFGAFLWFLALGVFQPVPAANIDVMLSGNPVRLGDTFTVTFSADDTPDGDPDFSPLGGSFDILSQSQSNQFSLDNGHASRRVAWEVALAARKAGRQEIPPIRFGKDQSRPLAVMVIDGGAAAGQGDDADIRLEVEAEPKNPYVQAQVLYTIRVLSRIQFSGSLGEPQADNAVLEKLDEDQQYMINRGGVQYRVDERRYAVFPQKSGRITISPVNLTAQIASQAGSPFGLFRPAARPRRFYSEPVELEVRPIPSQFKGQHWLPAAKLELDEAWTPSSLQVNTGEPLSRTLTIRAEGANLGLLPETLAGQGDVPGLRQYADQAASKEDKTADGFVGVRQQKTAVIGSHPGGYVLPAIEVPWWNTRTDQMEIARLPERRVTILPVAQAVAADPAIPAPAGVEQPDEPAPDASPARAPGQGLWFWLALLFGLGWLATALTWWWRSRAMATALGAVTDERESMADHALRKRIERACRANDALAARQAFMAWAGERWPGVPAGALASQCGPDLYRDIRQLERSLYAPGAAEWDGRGLWHSFDVWLKADRKGWKVSPASPALAVLHRIPG